MECPQDAVRQEGGQAVIESSVGLLLLCVIAAFTMNLYYLLAYVQTVNSSAAAAAITAAQGSASTDSGIDAAASAVAVGESMAANNTLGPSAPKAEVSICAQNSNCGFVDPESGSNGTSTGQFVSRSATTKQSFGSFMQGTILGQSILPFASSQSSSRSVYLRSMPAMAPLTAGGQ